MKFEKPLLLMATAILVIAVLAVMAFAGWEAAKTHWAETTTIMFLSPDNHTTVSNASRLAGDDNSKLRINWTFVNYTPMHRGKYYNCSLWNLTGNSMGILNRTDNVANSSRSNASNKFVNARGNNSWKIDNLSAELNLSKTFTFKVNCTNMSGGDPLNGSFNVSSPAFTLYFDNISPRIVNNSISMLDITANDTPMSNYSWVKGKIYINITIKDERNISNNSILFQIRNGTTNLTAWSGTFNFTINMSNSSSYGGTDGEDFYVATLQTENITDMAKGNGGTAGTNRHGDGIYYIWFSANDSITSGFGVDNRNRTGNTSSGAIVWTLAIDNTDPVITHTCTPTATFKSGAIECSCSGTATSGINDTIYTRYPSTATVGEFTTTCTITNNAGARVTDTITYTVRSTGGAAEQRLREGAPEATTRATVTQTIAAITAGIPQAVAIESTSVAITGVSITTTADVSDVKVTVESLSEKPATTPVPTGSIYQYFDIAATNIEDKLDSGEITFTVPKTWINSKNIDKNKVILHRYADTKWNALTTTLAEEGTTTITYKATTTGFSYFVITGQEEGAEVVAEEGAEEGEEVPAPTKIPTYVYYIIAIIIIAIAGYYGYNYYKNYKKKK